MTSEQIDAMECGPELDRAVAEAAGMEPEIVRGATGLTELWRVREIPRAFFRPSTDWSDAMYAAEQFGLFHRPDKHVDNVLGVPSEGVWMISAWDDTMDHYSGIATAPTGPLAICRAILKLAHAATSDT